jgi:hypothetical protein
LQETNNIIEIRKNIEKRKIEVTKEEVKEKQTFSFL